MFAEAFLLLLTENVKNLFRLNCLLSELLYFSYSNNHRVETFFLSIISFLHAFLPEPGPRLLLSWARFG